MKNYFGKKLIAALAAILFLAAAVVWRDKVSKFLTFQEGGQEIQNQIVFPSSTTTVAAEKSVLGNPQPKSQKPVSVPAIPPYTGRDPAEIRPVPDEIKLFTDDQRQQIYTSIKTVAETVKENPGYFNGWIKIGALKKTIGDYDGARDAWEYAGVIEPLNSLSFANVGELYWRYLHEYAKAEANLKISIAHEAEAPAHSQDVTTYLTLADLYQYSYVEKKDLAPQVLLDGLKINPGEETLMRHLAYIYELRGENAQALDWWKKIFANHPTDPELKSKIDALEAKLSSGN